MNRLLSLLVDEKLLNSCFNEVKAKRKEAHHNNDIWHLSHNWNNELPKIISDLLTGNYKISPAQQYHIKESDCNVTVWTARDTVVLNALKIVLERRIKNVSNFNCVSHLKDNGGVKGSVKKVSSFLKQGSFVFKTDIMDYYNSIDHKILINKIKRFTNEKMIQDLILQYVNVAHIKQGEYSHEKDVGIPRGHGLSNILSAIYLHSIDRLITKTNAKYIRYADDIIIVTKKRYQLKRLKQIVFRECTKLKLCLSLPKTMTSKVKDGIEYLGYFISASTLSIANKTIENMKNKVLWLKEQHAPKERVEEYKNNWRKWAIGGVCLVTQWNLVSKNGN